MTLALLLALVVLPLQAAPDDPDAIDIIESLGGGATRAVPPADAAERGRVATGQGVLATINGQAVTATDLALFVRQRAGGDVELAPEQAHGLRRQLAEQILLAGQAELAGVELSDGDVERYWEDYVGEVPDFAALAASTGSTVKRQRQMARRAVLAEIFVYHKIGLWSEYAQALRPDPLLQKLVDVTPGQMRSLFLEQPDLFSQPARVAYEFYACADEKEAESIRQLLLNGGQPLDRRPGQEEAELEKVPQLFAFSEALVHFMRHAPDGTVSQVFEADFQGDVSRGYVVFQLAGRSEAHDPAFAEVQDDLRRVLISSRVEEARRQLVAKLEPEAFYWPDDLFRDPTARTGVLKP